MTLTHKTGASSPLSALTGLLAAATVYFLAIWLCGQYGKWSVPVLLCISSLGIILVGSICTDTFSNTKRMPGFWFGALLVSIQVFVGALVAVLPH